MSRLYFFKWDIASSAFIACQRTSGGKSASRFRIDRTRDLAFDDMRFLTAHLYTRYWNGRQQRFGVWMERILEQFF